MPASTSAAAAAAVAADQTDFVIHAEALDAAVVDNEIVDVAFVVVVDVSSQLVEEMFIVVTSIDR